MLVALFAVLARPAGCQEEDSGGFDFKQDVRQLAVADGQVYVATDDWLHQLSHDLRLSQRVSLLGVWNGTGMLRRVSEANERSATFGVHVLLPFVRNRTLIICGSISGCGYCEIRNLGKISEVIHWEQIQVGPHWRSSESVAVVVNLTKTQGPTEMYILTAVEHPRQYLSIFCGDTNTLRLLNTKEDQRGGIFSISSDSSSADLEYKGSGKVKFVDGFQIGAVIYLILYEENITTQAHLLWFEGNEGKSIKDIHGAILAPGDASKKATKVVASCLVPGVPRVPKVLWVGVFAVDGEKTNTQLVLFDISSNLKNRTEMEFPLGRPPNPAEKVSMALLFLNFMEVLCQLTSPKKKQFTFSLALFFKMIYYRNHPFVMLHKVLYDLTKSWFLYVEESNRYKGIFKVQIPNNIFFDGRHNCNVRPITFLC